MLFTTRVQYYCITVGLGSTTGSCTRIIASSTQHRNAPANVDFRVVLERDESIRSINLTLDSYGTDEQAALGAWVLLEANIALPQLAPVADPDPRAMMSRSGRLRSIPQCSPYRHCQLMRLLVVSLLLCT